MNFQELMQRIAELDQPVIEEPNEGNLFTGNLAKARADGKDQADLDGDGDMEKVSEDDIEECGMDPMSSMKQQDNVSMNVSMNGSGAGGIRDLLDILKNIDDTNSGDDLGDLIDKMDSGPGKMAVIDGGEMPVDEYANEPDEVYGNVGDVMPTGNDIHSKGSEAPKVNGGGNPMAMETLISRLDALYQEVKTR
jgi:hypothetical protein